MINVKTELRPQLRVWITVQEDTDRHVYSIVMYLQCYVCEVVHRSQEDVSMGLLGLGQIT